MRVSRLLLLFTLAAAWVFAGPPPAPATLDLAGNWSVSIDGRPVTDWHAVVWTSGDTVSIAQHPWDDTAFWWELRRSGTTLQGRDEDDFTVGGEIAQRGDEMTIVSTLGTGVLNKAPPRLVRGTVVSAEGGRPIRGAQVEESSMFSGGSRAPPPAVTDSGGLFTLRRDALDPFTFNVIVSATGFAPIFTSVSHESDWTLALERSVLVTGRVVDPTGNGVPDAVVSLRPTREPSSFHNGPAGDSVKTDATGHFESKDLPSGPFSVYVQADGFLAISDLGFTTRRVDVVLQPAGGTRLVVRTGGRPLVRDPGSRLAVCSTMTDWLYVDHDGVIRGSLPLGRQRIRVRSFALGAVEADVTVGPEKEVVFLDLERRGAVHGRVVDKVFNRGVPGVEVTIQEKSDKDDRCGYGYGSVVSGEDGRFEILGLSSALSLGVGQLPKGFSDTDLPDLLERSAPIEAIADETDAVLTVYSAGRIAGRVLEASGTPSTRTGNVIIRPIGYERNHGGSGYEAPIENGRFELENSVPWSYTYRVEVCGWEGRSVPVDTAPDSLIELRLLPAATVKGRVVLDGIPIKEFGTRVDVDYFENGEWTFCSGSYLKEDGRFSVQVAEGGRATLGIIGNTGPCGHFFRSLVVTAGEIIDLGDVEVGCKDRQKSDASPLLEYFEAGIEKARKKKAPAPKP